MISYLVTITPSAELAIEQQLVFISQNSLTAALSWETRLRKAFAYIGKMPKGFPVDQSLSKINGIEIRKMTFERTYLVFYTLDHSARKATVVHFRHGKRLPLTNVANDDGLDSENE